MTLLGGPQCLEMLLNGFLTHRPAGRVEKRGDISAEGLPQIRDGYRVWMEKAIRILRSDRAVRDPVRVRRDVSDFVGVPVEESIDAAVMRDRADGDGLAICSKWRQTRATP